MNLDNILGMLYKVWIIIPVLVSVFFVTKGLFLFRNPKGRLNIFSGILCFSFYLLYKLTITYALPHSGMIDNLGLFLMNLMLIPIIILSSSSIFEDNARKLLIFPLCLIIIWGFNLADKALAAFNILD